MVSVVLASGVADIVQSLLEASGIALNKSDTEGQGVFLARLLEVRETVRDRD